MTALDLPWSQVDQHPVIRAIRRKRYLAERRERRIRRKMVALANRRNERDLAYGSRAIRRSKALRKKHAVEIRRRFGRFADEVLQFYDRFGYIPYDMAEVRDWQRGPF